MSHANERTKRIWLVQSKQHHFVIAATAEKSCKQLIDELAEEVVTEKFTYKIIGNIAPTLPFYDTWNGEDMILASNF